MQQIETKWVSQEPNKVWKFQLGEEPEVMHIIESCGSDYNGKIYIVVFEDAYGLSTGNTEVLSKKEIEKKYKITLI